MCFCEWIWLPRVLFITCCRFVYELETSYLQESSNFGNVWKGYEGFLSSSKNTAKLICSLRFIGIHFKPLSSYVQVLRFLYTFKFFSINFL
ncbi:hypothetical protein HanIR_Chr00c09g0906931 [Helianthus annuus]|nr:hypothetical protein HanIR_Chr00c09g0906931 [Helianthus annuus]